MPDATFMLSAFGDEMGDELATHLDVLSALYIHYLELRGAIWMKVASV